MKKLIYIIITLLLLISLTLGGYTFLKTRQQSKLSNSETVVKEGFLKTKIGNEYLLETNSGLVTLVEGKVKPISFMKQKIKVEGVYSGDKLFVNKITRIK